MSAPEIISTGPLAAMIRSTLLFFGRSFIGAILSSPPIAPAVPLAEYPQTLTAPIPQSCQGIAEALPDTDAALRASTHPPRVARAAASQGKAPPGALPAPC